MNVSFVRVAMLIVAGGLVGCGGGFSNDATPPFDASIVDANDGAIGDAANDSFVSDARTEADADVDAPPGLGLVVLESDGTGAAARGTIGATFVTVREAPTDCAKQTVGACTLTRCDGSGSPGEFDPHSAGPIIVGIGGTIITMLPSADAKYTAFSSAAPLWRDRDRVIVSADGDEAPAFRATLAAPTVVTITGPDFVAPAPIDRGSPLVVTWSNGASGDLVELITSSPGALYPEITCAFPAGEGNGTIDHALLSQLASGEAPVYFTVLDQTTIVAANWTTTITLTSIARFPNGKQAVGSWTLR